jgi:hypothetical protein
MKKTLPALDIKTGINHSPHVVILGAGASRACCLQGDAAGRRLPVMNDFADIVGVGELLKDAGENPGENFEAVYSRLHKAGNLDVLHELEQAVHRYFAGLTLPEVPTIYDRLVLSLRPKDLIVTFNWDPLLIQAYKRWRNRGVKVPPLAFLHGNVDVGVDLKKRCIGFITDPPKEGVNLAPTKLLFPVEQKNYSSDEFIDAQWKLAASHLERAYFVTIFGYSAPATDVEAKKLLLDAWQQNTTRTLAEIEIIDIRDHDEVMGNWSDFIEGNHGGAYTDFSHSYLMHHPRRSCEAFAFATLQQAPWADNDMPDFASTDEMMTWIQPLLDEEDRGQLIEG